jgi:hypothetical protein
MSLFCVINKKNTKHGKTYRTNCMGELSSADKWSDVQKTFPPCKSEKIAKETSTRITVMELIKT